MAIYMQTIAQPCETPSDDHLLSVRRIIRSFVERIPGASIRFDPPDTDILYSATQEEIHRLKLDVNVLKPWLRWGCQVVQNFYPDHPLDLQVTIVVCNLIIFYIDDVLSHDPSRLYNFQRNLLTGQPQDEPHLECLVKKLIPRMWDHFTPLAANTIAVGFYEFIIGTAMEDVTKKMEHHPRAPNFPEYIRLKSGAPAQYSYWLFPRAQHPDPGAYIQAIPDILAIINRVNDILSFYKEELAGEDDNYVHMRAKLARADVLAALDAICDETLRFIEDILATLAGAPAAQAVFRDFLPRYLRFHLSTSRYLLKELFADSRDS